jgi:hypothetical protein
MAKAALVSRIDRGTSMSAAMRPSLSEADLLADTNTGRWAGWCSFELTWICAFVTTNEPKHAAIYHEEAGSLS